MKAVLLPVKSLFFSFVPFFKNLFIIPCFSQTMQYPTNNNNNKKKPAMSPSILSLNVMHTALQHTSYFQITGEGLPPVFLRVETVASR